MNSEDEFLKAMAMIELLPVLDKEYRIYFDEQGNITHCTMSGDPLDQPYIVVTLDEYTNYSKYTVENNKLKLIDNNPGYRVQLSKSEVGYKTVKNHAGLVLEPGETYENVEHYDANN